jgi:hypothetical protein
MSTLYVAKSPAQQEWGGEVGISQHVYKVGLAEGAGEAAAKEAVAALNEIKHAGQSDWELIGWKEALEETEEAVVARLAERQKMIDPLYYPKLKGARGIFRVNVRNVEAHYVIKSTMEGKVAKVPKLKPKDVADYLLNAAQAQPS